MDILKTLMEDLKPQVEAFQFKGNTYYMKKGGIDASVKAQSLGQIMAAKKLAGMKGDLQALSVNSGTQGVSIPEVEALTKSEYQNAYEKALHETAIICSAYCIYAMCLVDENGKPVCETREQIADFANSITPEFIEAATVAMNKLNESTKVATEDEKN